MPRVWQANGRGCGRDRIPHRRAGGEGILTKCEEVRGYTTSNSMDANSKQEVTGATVGSGPDPPSDRLVFGDDPARPEPRERRSREPRTREDRLSRTAAADGSRGAKPSRVALRSTGGGVDADAGMSRCASGADSVRPDEIAGLPDPLIAPEEWAAEMARRNPISGIPDLSLPIGPSISGPSRISVREPMIGRPHFVRCNPTHLNGAFHCWNVPDVVSPVVDEAFVELGIEALKTGVSTATSGPRGLAKGLVKFVDKALKARSNIENVQRMQMRLLYGPLGENRAPEATSPSGSSKP
jgi:hypothetical protein